MTASSNAPYMSCQAFSFNKPPLAHTYLDSNVGHNGEFQIGIGVCVLDFICLFFRTNSGHDRVSAIAYVRSFDWFMAQPNLLPMLEENVEDVGSNEARTTGKENASHVGCVDG